ncbi:hypothetical protein B0H10DRAFT_2088089 [Mycena sp. CBHHK59/15]|nr:hypothetical protein B0H10DRAFT_2088089 [Mycena sp. CBHHK59/15]
MGNINASPRPATRSLCVKLIASVLGTQRASFRRGTRFKFDVSLPDDETRARAIEGAIFRATRGDLRLYQGTFRRIYLHLRNKTRLNVTVIGLRGAQTFNLLRRHTIKKLRLAVRQRLGGQRLISSGLRYPNSLHMRAQERVYYVPHMVVVQSGSCKYRFGVAPTYALNSLCGFFPMEPNFQLQYQARPIDTADTPETLGAPREREFLLSASYRNRATSVILTAMGPEDPDALLSEPLTPSEERYWTWESGTPPPGSVQVTPQYETRLRERKA